MKVNIKPTIVRAHQRNCMILLLYSVKTQAPTVIQDLMGHRNIQPHKQSKRENQFRNLRGLSIDIKIYNVYGPEYTAVSILAKTRGASY